MYVSITRLDLKSNFRLPGFMWWVFWIERQAKKADGNLGMELNRVGNQYYTLTHWKSKKHMRNFMLSGAHKNSMKHTPFYSDVNRAMGFETDKKLEWPEAMAKIDAHPPRGQA